MKRVAVVLAAVGFAAGPLRAAPVGSDRQPPPKVERTDKGERKPDGRSSPLQDLTLTGKFVQIERKVKVRTSDGEKEETRPVFVLILDDGTEVSLPEGKAKAKGKDGNGDAKVFILADYVDSNVTISAKGLVVEKAGRKSYQVKDLVNIAKNLPMADDRKPASP
jgi:hypothetical protein